MSLFGEKYKFDINSYLTTTSFNQIEQGLDRPNIIYFFSNIGFMATLHVLIMTFIHNPNKNICINDIYWNGKCSDLNGIKCYFSDDSLLVKILDNDKTITEDTSIVLNALWIKDEELYNKVNKINLVNPIIKQSQITPKNPDLVLKQASLLFNQMWKLNPTITDIIDYQLSILNKKSYIAIHIRMGDKVGKFDKRTKEAEIPDLNKIPQIIEKILKDDPEIDTVFIATDDVEAIDMVYDLLIDSPIKKMSIITFATEKNTGYDQQKFNKTMSQEESFLSNVSFIVDFSALIRAKYYIGTVSSNITRFVIMSDNIPYNRIYNIDSPTKRNRFIEGWFRNIPINNI
jgi:hypothetical protein